MQILFGSQSGNAESIATRIYQKVSTLGYSATLGALDTFDETRPLFLIIITSTTGQVEIVIIVMETHQIMLANS